MQTMIRSVLLLSISFMAFTAMAVQRVDRGARPVWEEPVTGDAIKVAMFTVEGEPVGYIFLEDTDKGLRFTPNLTGLPLGDHAFHVHENPRCEATQAENGESIPAGAAGPHYDPQHTQKHAGPMAQDGHLGDLPVLTSQGLTYRPVLAPRLKIADIRQRSLIIHRYTDNYTDSPEAGGSGPRIACGIIP